MSNAKWLAVLDTNICIQEFFYDIYIPYDCDFLVLHSSGDDNLQISMIYHIGRTLPIQIISLGSWRGTGGILWKRHSLVKPKELQGIMLKIAMYPYQHEMIYKYVNLSVEDIKACNVLGIEIYLELENTLNFTSSFCLPKDLSPGVVMENGSMSGVLKMVATKEIDIGLSPLDFTHSRMDVVDYLGQIWDSPTTILMREPETEGSGMKQWLSPFKENVWLVVVISSVVLTIIHAIYWVLDNHYSDTTRNKMFTLLESIVGIIGIIFQQGSNLKPRLLSCRVVYFSMYITTIIIFMTYSATFMSFLAVRKQKLPFTNFKECFDDGTYKLRTWPNSATLLYFQESPDAILRKIYKKMIEPNLNTTTTNVLYHLEDLCRNSKTGFIYKAEFVHYFSKSFSCKIVGLRDSWIPSPSSFIIYKKHPFKELFVSLIKRLRGTGILTRILTRMSGDHEDRKFHTKTFTVTNIKTVSVFFVIFGGGMVLSFLILFLELLYCKLVIK